MLVENRDFVIPLAFDARVGGSPSECCHATADVTVKEFTICLAILTSCLP